MHDEVKKAVKTSLNSAHRVALTCDGWTSRTTEPYVTVTSHHISDDWEMVTQVLQMRAMHESHTGSNIADLLKRAMKEWGIKDKNSATVTDNTSNMTSKSATCQDLEKRYLDEQRETLHVCTALDPRFKALHFLPEDERQAVYDRVIAETARNQEPFQVS